MRKLLTLLLLVGCSKLYSQSLVQTYVDRCTGAVNVFTVPMNGQATIAFYNKTRTFTSQQFQNGELRAWLEETYLWWSSLSPCSTAQTNTTATQAATQQAAQAAQAAAAPNPPTDGTSTQNTSQNSQSSNSTDTGDSSSNTDSNSQNNSEGNTGEDNSGTSEGESGGGGGSEEETKTEETKSEETESEDSKEEVKEDKEEKKKEDKKEDKEEKKKEKEDKKEEKKKKKKKTLAPPIIIANTMVMKGLDGSYTNASNLGISRSSLMGDKTYSLNTMIWSNLKQFMLNFGFSKVHINKKGRVSRVYSSSIGGAKMYSTYMGMVNNSVVFLGEKGSATGITLGNSITSIEQFRGETQDPYNELLLSSSITGFYTISVPYNRFSFSPMIAISSQFLNYELKSKSTVWNSDKMIIMGVSTTFRLSKNFGANIGINTIASTNPNIPVTWNYTIGSRFSF